ncbi:hypothetical protein CKAH01_03721 [Colletotrichum kahawae]|uniref:Uncharacterized protein n=1 Tax=Colletotrichum kahawae TaxID=34407 RepID=A0AAE0DBH0_COLKA|nr:hypothetical protein CKAH01_03721 [Colletotrichum kahawae]
MKTCGLVILSCQSSNISCAGSTRL